MKMSEKSENTDPSALGWRTHSDVFIRNYHLILVMQLVSDLAY